MSTMVEKVKRRTVAFDLESERGVYLPGRYYVMGPRFDFIGTLDAVTAMTFVFSDVSIVFESGPYADLFGGHAKDVQRLEGSDRTVVDRAGYMLHHFAK